MQSNRLILDDNNSQLQVQMNEFVSMISIQLSFKVPIPKIKSSHIITVNCIHYIISN